MHEKDSFARMPGMDSGAEHPSLEDLLLTYEDEREVAFKEELYLVRDNGAVFRRARPKARRRMLDEAWTFGRLNRHSGYFGINGHVIHRIVATAFHGPQPSASHVVDHIDTNRQNNRAENLRWVTRLENILLNPITRNRIEMAYGSLDAFFENPGACPIPNWDWMQIVTKEQAQECRRRLLEWAEKGQLRGDGSLGDWLYEPADWPSSSDSEKTVAEEFAANRAVKREVSGVRPRPSRDTHRQVSNRRSAVEVRVSEPQSLDSPSRTRGAFQRKWRTPTEFPACPSVVSEGLAAYQGKLVSGATFARSEFGESTVVEAAIGTDGVLSVVCNSPSGIKGWSHARVYVEGEAFCHEAGGTFFSREGAMKAHCISIGAPFDAYDGSIDDYC